MRELIEDELGRSVDEVFAEFEWEPIAAASIGQVYRATLRTGEPVIVKAQRPRVAGLVERDTKVLLRLAQTAENNTPLGAEYRVHELASEFARSLHEELDFRIEAKNTTTIADNMAEQPLIRVPVIYDDYSTARLMVQERLDGVGIDQFARDRRHAAPTATVLADALLRAVLTQMMTDGFFHADLHPGNLMVLRRRHPRHDRLRRHRPARSADAVVAPADAHGGEHRRPGAAAPGGVGDHGHRRRRRPRCPRAGAGPVHGGAHRSRVGGVGASAIADLMELPDQVRHRGAAPSSPRSRVRS